MSGVRQLVIRGLRSFGSDDADTQHIVFTRPLTLILGENGCGKTTLVEALKFALCDELPPNSDHGRSFVHDPKIDNCKEVLAQVRLEFTDAKNSKYFVARSLQTQVKLKKLQFQRLDNFLKTLDERGNQVEISGRCGDVNNTISSILGVSKAILNNVIFCHQEDSNWPLEEGKKLKERFDAIFDATKYNKCFEHIRKMRKKYSVDIKLLEQEVQHLTEKKEIVERKRSKLYKDEEKIKIANDKLHDIKIKLIPIEKRLQEIDSIETNIVHFKSRRELAKTRKEHCHIQYNQLIKCIVELYNGSKEELILEIESFETNLKRKEKELKEAENDLQNLKNEESTINVTISSNDIKKSELFTLEGQNQDKTSQRNKNLLNLATFCGITNPNNIDDDDDANSLYEKVTAEHLNVKKKLQKSTKNAEIEEKILQSNIDTCRDTLTRHKEKIRNKEKELETLITQIKKIQSDIDNANESKSNLENIKKEVESCDINLQSIMSECDVSATETNIDKDEKEISKLESELEALDKKITKLQHQQTKQNEISIQKDSLCTKQKNFNRIKNKNKETMTALLGDKIPEKNFKTTFKKCKDDLKNEVELLNKNLKRKQNEITSLEANRRHTKNELDKKRSELSASVDKIEEYCKSQTLDEVLSKLDTEVGKLQDQKTEFSSSEFVIQKFVNQLESTDPCCPLCHRGFETKQEVSDLVSELQDKIHDVPKKLDSVLHNLSRKVKKRDELITLRPLNDKIISLRTQDIPLLENNLLKIDEELSEARNTTEELMMSLIEPENKLSSVDSMLSDMPLLDNLASEISSITAEISKLEENLGSQYEDFNLDNGVAKQTELKKSLVKLRLNIKANQTNLNKHNEKLNMARERRNRLKEKYLQAQSNVQELSSFQDRHKESTETKDKLVFEINKANDESSKLNETLRSAEKNKEKVVVKLRNDLDRDRAFESTLDKKVCAIQVLNNELEAHKLKNIHTQLNDLRIKMEQLNKEREKIVQAKNEKNLKINQISDEISNQLINKRNLEDNLSLRSLESEKVQLEKEIKEIDDKVGELNYTTLSSEKKALRTSDNNMNLEVARTEGEIKQLQDIVKQTKTELMEKQFKNVHEVFRSKLYELELLKAADKDIKDYAYAMDCCLMKYHKEKMDKINFIIRDLWRNIYRGNDIDYIEIKTDESASQTTTGNRRVYDYRVVQRRNDVEIDMRGRCSAGQKVLASLIIRMALAETFSNRFGVLALDEPTTNLDRENVTSLCYALRDMILSRMKQNNFLFIIITHDAEFLNSLGQIDKIRHYYRISRNQDGKSRITKESMP